MKFFDKRSMSYDFVISFDCWTCTGDLFTWSVMDGIEPAYQDVTMPRGIMPMTDDGRNVGICLSCNRKSKNANKRSIDQNDVIPGLIADDKRICSLQKGATYDDFANVDCRKIGICNDFLDTAMLINCMDQVITCDTVIAHLAGMLGKKTDLLTTDYVDWRWKYVDSEKNSLLYPSIHVKKLK